MSDTNSKPEEGKNPSTVKPPVTGQALYSREAEHAVYQAERAAYEAWQRAKQELEQFKTGRG